MLFAKAPVAGRVKTRLVPPLTFTEAAELHIAFVDDILKRFQQLSGVDVELHTDVSTDAWPNTSVTRKYQISGGLELKMFHALESALSAGYARAMIVGTDAPSLPLEYAASLLRSGADVALGPAEDGGFWGISACETNPNMFDQVSWSRSDTLEQTVRALHIAGLSTEIGRTWFDVDEPADLNRLLEQDELPPATRHWSEKYQSSIAARTTGL
jgi:rSAM/selenodomain-associated transferase 1